MGEQRPHRWGRRMNRGGLAGRCGGGHGGRCRTLDEVESGEHARIRGHRARGAVRQRLLDLGLHPNADVTMVRVAPLGDPIEFRLDSSLIALRRAEALLIDIL